MMNLDMLWSHQIEKAGSCLYCICITHTSFINTVIAYLSFFVCCYLIISVSIIVNSEQHTTSKLLEVKCREAGIKPGTHFFPNICCLGFQKTQVKECTSTYNSGQDSTM